MVRTCSNSSIEASAAVRACSLIEDPWSVQSGGMKDRVPSGKSKTHCSRLCRCVRPRTAND
jgi:hypothetical protein